MDSIFTNALSKWMDGTGPSGETVISCRVRLARNISGKPFPHRNTPEEATGILSEVSEAVEDVKRTGWSLDFYPLDTFTPLERQVLVEKHLISPQHAQNPHGALVVSPDEQISVMVNEEDHLRIQCLLPGLQLSEAWKSGTALDDAMEGSLTLAFHEKLGYVTACPTNVGSALRASLMMHLPALVLTKRIGSVVPAITRLGLVVRGLYGEGTEATGNIFQISNQVTLGKSEEEILDNLRTIGEQIIEHEGAARQSLLDNRSSLEDKVWRAYGILANARVLSSEEAIRLWSHVRLGADMGIVQLDRAVLNELIVLSRPAFISRLSGRDLEPAERDEVRATHVRKRIKGS